MAALVESLTLFIDTNHFLHYPPLADRDWCAECGAKSVKLVVCMPVIHELDEKKSNPRLKDRAERAIRELKAIRAKGGVVRPAVTLDTIHHEIPREQFDGGMNPDRADDAILMHVKLYEDIARFGHIATSYAYPVKVNARYVMDPSPTPKFDNPKMDDCPALQLFGAGREKRIYAIPPHTRVVSLDFEDHPFTPYRFDAPFALCGADDSYLDEIVTDYRGSRMFVCSDTDYCEGRQAAGHRGTESAAPHKESAHG